MYFGRSILTIQPARQFNDETNFPSAAAVLRLLIGIFGAFNRFYVGGGGATVLQIG